MKKTNYTYIRTKNLNLKILNLKNLNLKNSVVRRKSEIQNVQFFGGKMQVLGNTRVPIICGYIIEILIFLLNEP